MLRSLVAVVVLLPLVAPAADGGVSAAGEGASDVEALRRDFDAKLEAARREVKELRDELKAQLNTQQATQGWQEDWVGEKRKLELVTLDGYLRVRPELFWRFDLNRGLDPAGYSLWPRSPNSNFERTNAGVNMRFRFEPTLNVSEDVRIRTQIDALDNVVWGTTPDYAFSRNAPNGFAYDRNDFSLFSFGGAPPRSGLNSFTDSITFRRVWGEVATPLGILRFGRMGSHWGLGMLHNDGNGIDNDWGDTVDRFSFTVEPLPGFYITPMLDFNVEGPSSIRLPEGGQPFDLSQSDDVRSYILVLARRDTETERAAKLDSGQLVFNYGLHFMYRYQRNDSVDNLSAPFVSDGQVPTGRTTPQVFVTRQGNLFIPDLWAKLEGKNWRVEVEAAAIIGNLQNRALTGAAANTPGQNQALDVLQFGAVLQGEYGFLNGDLEVGAEVGFASGDPAFGFGNYPRRRGSGALGFTGAGDIDGPQYSCPSSGGCDGAGNDNRITNFRFNRDYRVDMILYREILGSITDSLYVKPKVKYRITKGLEAFVAGIYSRALFKESTPGANASGGDHSLGLELNGGVRFESDEGLYGQLMYGIMFPLGGFARDAIAGNASTAVTLDNAQAVRAILGIRF